MDSFRSRRPSLCGEQFVRKQINGKCSERKNCGIKSKAESDDEPIRLVETKEFDESAPDFSNRLFNRQSPDSKRLAKFDLVDGTALAQSVASLSPGLEEPIAERTDHREHTSSHRNK